MDEKDLCNLLPANVRDKAIGNVSRVNEDFIDDFLHSSLPQSKQPTISSELKKNFALIKFKTYKKKTQHCKRKGHLTLKERRELGLYKLKRKGYKYEDFLPLHSLWKKYIKSYLGIEEIHKMSSTEASSEQMAQALLKGDFHGALVKVLRSTCSSLVGHSGILIFDTKNTFKLICKDNIVRTIPKETCVFSVALDSYTFTIFGKHFCIRPNERSVRKIRTFMVPDL